MNLNFSTPLAGYLADSVCEARHRYRSRFVRCQRKYSTRAVHELRVETRRILSILALLEALCFSAPIPKLRKALKRRLDAFDGLRDTQVQLRLLKLLWEDFPKARDFKKLLRRSEKKLISKLAGEIKTTKNSRLNRRLKRIEKELGKKARTKVFGEGYVAAFAALRAAFNRVVARRRQISRNDAATIHRMRVAFKEFRYLSELLQPFTPQVTARRLDRMKDFQAMAGDIQDLEVLLAHLAQALEEKQIGAASIQNLRRELLRRRRRAIQFFMARVDDLFEFEPKNPVVRRRAK